METNQEWQNLLNKALKNPDIDNNFNKAYQYIIDRSMSGRDDVDIMFKIK